jgi:hypothetical protein
VFSVFEATIVNGDSLSFGLHAFVFPYSHTRSSYISPSSQFQSLLSLIHHPQDEHGKETAVTIQFPPISATGDGMFSQAF